MALVVVGSWPDRPGHLGGARHQDDRRSGQRAMSPHRLSLGPHVEPSEADPTLVAAMLGRGGHPVRCRDLGYVEQQGLGDGGGHRTTSSVAGWGRRQLQPRSLQRHDRAAVGAEMAAVPHFRRGSSRVSSCGPGSRYRPVILLLLDAGDRRPCGPHRHCCLPSLGRAATPTIRSNSGCRQRRAGPCRLERPGNVRADHEEASPSRTPAAIPSSIERSSWSAYAAWARRSRPRPRS